MIKFLTLEHGADLKSTNRYGGTRHQIVQLLVDAGANVNLADREGVTPLQHARSRRFSKIEKILLTAGAH